MTVVQLLEQVEIFKDAHFGWFVAIMYTTFLANAALLLPLYGLLSVAFAFVINDFLLGSVLLSIMPTLVSLTMFLTVSNTTIPYLRTKLQRFSIFRHLDHNMDASAFAICLVIRFLYIPVGLKEYSILVLRYPFRANILSAILYFGIHSIIFAGVGSQLHNANEMYKRQFWEHMSMQEKLDLALIFGSVALTISVFVYVTFWMRNRVMEDNNIDLSKCDDADNVSEDSEERDRLVS